MQRNKRQPQPSPEDIGEKLWYLPEPRSRFVLAIFASEAMRRSVWSQQRFIATGSQGFGRETAQDVATGFRRPVRSGVADTLQLILAAKFNKMWEGGEVREVVSVVNGINRIAGGNHTAEAMRITVPGQSIGEFAVRAAEGRQDVLLQTDPVWCIFRALSLRAVESVLQQQSVAE